MTALLELGAARIDLDGVPLLDGLTASGEGPRLGLVGDWSGLFELAAGRARLAAGRASIAGHDVATAIRDGVLAVVPVEPLLPSDWTVARYLGEAGQLAGLRKREAGEAARSGLATLRLAHLAERRAGTLTLAEKRAVVLALALTSGASVLAVEDPARGLDDRSEALLLELVSQVAAGRSLVVSSTRARATGRLHGLFAGADEVLVLESGVLVGSGKLEQAVAPGSVYVVTVSDNGQALARELAGRGVAAQLSKSTGELAPIEAAAGVELAGAARLVVQLPEGATSSLILDAALAAHAPMLELLPVQS